MSLSGGAAAALGSLVGAATGSGPYRTPALLAGLSAAVAGAYDDLLAARSEQREDKGWRGHVRAARSGRLSGGTVKVVVIGAGALAAGARATATHAARDSAAGDSAATENAVRPPASQVLRDAALIAGTANLVNLFDLRPGRAGKVALVAALVTGGGPAGPLSAAVAGAAATTLPGDVAERRMLGDLGANTLGALLGVRLASARPGVRNTALAVVVALTAASEHISFSAVINSTPALRAVDRWGRRPADADAASLQ
ncbi:MAG: hypothetical protein ABJA87_06930 [bacterium]